MVSMTPADSPSCTAGVTPAHLPRRRTLAVDPGGTPDSGFLPAAGPRSEGALYTTRIGICHAPDVPVRGGVHGWRADRPLWVLDLPGPAACWESFLNWCGADRRPPRCFWDRWTRDCRDRVFDQFLEVRPESPRTFGARSCSSRRFRPLFTSTTRMGALFDGARRSSSNRAR